MTDEAQTSGSLPWRRLGAEFVVIVVGVLVALGADAARQASADRAREAAYLRQLKADPGTHGFGGQPALPR